MTRTSPAPVWRLKVELLDVSPAIWRRFDIDADVTLSQLHYAIQGVMGWELMHLCSFQDGRGYGIKISSDMRLCDACGVGEALRYTYDFGDGWEHLVTMEKQMVKPTGTYPKMVAGKNACPPEDCGGSWGYADMLKILASGKGARRRELIEWLGGPFDPKAFNLDAAGERLAEYFAASLPQPDVCE